MMKNKEQKGRPLLEMLIVISIGFILTAFAILSGQKVIRHYKANAMLDYINLVFISVRGRSVHDPKFGMEVENPRSYPCDLIVPNMPGFMDRCYVNRICGRGSNTELGNRNRPVNSEKAILAANSTDYCVTTVSAYFKNGEDGAASTLESKLGLEVRENMPNDKRVFMKANCAADYPVECANGFAKCVSRGAYCSDMSRQ